MAPVTRTRTRKQPAQAKQNDKEEADPKTASRKRTRTSPKTSKAKKRRQDGAGVPQEGSDDRGSTPAAAAAKGIKETKADIRKKAGDVARLMEKQLRKETLDKHTPTVADLLPPDINLALHNGTNGTPSNKTFHQAQQCLTSLQDLVRSYESLSQNSCVDTQGPTRAHWDQDEANLRALSESAMGAAFEVLNGIILPHGNGDPNRDRKQVGGSSDIDAMAGELLSEAVPRGADATWGTTARDLFRIFSEAVELFPETR